MIKPITIFISYAHEDSSFMEELGKYLKPEIRNKKVSVWTDRDIIPGQKWDELIRTKLRDSEIIIFLVSQDFLASDYISNVEIKNAIEHERLIIIPIIVRPIEMDQFALNSYQVLPFEGKAISKWENKDDAWLDVIRSLRVVFDKINGKDTTQHNGTESQKIFSSITGRANSTDKMVITLVLLLISISMVVFGFGLIKESQFHVFVSLIGIGIGLLGYFLMRKFFAY